MEERIVSRIGRPPPGGWSLRDLTGGRTAINPILDQAWETYYPWGTEHGPAAGGSLGAAAPRPGPG
ncbi:hypothetical protein ACWDG9_16360 [Streptomyces sp. NPDC001073]